MQNKGIIGTVCGDIIGSAYEFHKTKDWNFKLFTPRSTFTDDTVMTCAVAELRRGIPSQRLWRDVWKVA